jgi:hypothetical protein
MQVLRDRLQVIVRTRDRIDLQEKPHFIAGVFFIILGLATIVASLRRYDTEPLATVLVMLIGIGILTLGIFGLVRSTISAERNKGFLRVQHQLGRLTFHIQYPAGNIKRVFERKTRKGNGLRIELIDGRKKNLSLWTELFCARRASGCAE